MKTKILFLTVIAGCGILFATSKGGAATTDECYSQYTSCCGGDTCDESCESALSSCEATASDIWDYSDRSSDTSSSSSEYPNCDDCKSSSSSEQTCINNDLCPGTKTDDDCAGAHEHLDGGQCYCDDGYSETDAGDCEKIDLSTEKCETDADCTALGKTDYKCDSDGSCVPNSIVGSECKNDDDCKNNYGDNYTCSGAIKKTCELSSSATSKSVATTSKATTVTDKTTGKTVNVPANSIVKSDGSIWSSDGQTQLASAGTVAGASSLGSSSSSGVLTMCANGSIATTCTTSGGTTLSRVSSSGYSAGNFSSGYNSSAVAGLTGGACGAGFQSVGGVCFPINTGLSSASVSVILANIFSWLMGLFTTFAVIAFIISGIQYLTSAGDTDQIEKAKHNAMYAILGVIIGLSGFVIVKAIAAALSGQSYFF
jgi:hypothetical protein